MVPRADLVPREDLEVFQSKLDALPEKINEKRKLLESVESQLVQLYVHKKQLAEDIAQETKMLRAADARKKVLDTQNMLENLRRRVAKHNDKETLDELNARIDMQERELLEAEKNQGDFRYQVVPSELEDAMTRAREKLVEGKSTEQKLLMTIRESEQQRDIFTVEVQSLENQQAIWLSNSNIYRYTKEPHRLIEELRNNVTEQINAMHRFFPAGQTERLRLVLAQLPTMLAEIHNSVIVIGSLSERAKQYRNAFYQCCGLLYELIDFVDHDNFRSRISALLNDVNPKTARDAYQRNKIELKNAQEFDLRQYEQDVYARAKNAVTDWLQEVADDSIKRRTQALMNAISKGENDEKFDRPYYTQFLKDTLAAVKNPEDSDKRQQYRNTLRQIPDGKPATVRKIVGCGLVLLGVLIFAASAVASCLSLGVAAPISIAGMVGGGLLVVSGVGLFASGCGRGNYKKGEALQSSLEKTAKTLKKLN